MTRGGHTVSAGLLADGHYRSQWVTGASAGSRSAITGGERQRFEHDHFGGTYADADPTVAEFPAYRALDLLFDPHGGSPRFGSSYIVLHAHVRARTTLCIGDSHTAPQDVGTFAAPWSILAGLSEQAARSQLLDRRLGTDALDAALRESFRSDQPSRDLDGYVEAQVHGGVSLAHDVEAVVADPWFRATSVEHDLAEAAERYGVEVRWHDGSELHADEVPDDFRGPTMPALARRVARPDGVVDAHAIGVEAARVTFEEPNPAGDAPESAPQQLKYLWHTVLSRGGDAVAD